MKKDVKQVRVTFRIDKERQHILEEVSRREGMNERLSHCEKCFIPLPGELQKA